MPWGWGAGGGGEGGGGGHVNNKQCEETVTTPTSNLPLLTRRGPPI